MSSLVRQRSLMSVAALSRAHATAAPAVPAASTSLQQSVEWLRARPFEEIPGPRPLPLVGNLWRFLPPLGEFRKLDPVGMLVAIRERYGDIAKVVGVPFKQPMVYLFSPDDIQKVYRHEGPWPRRGSVQSVSYYRTVTRRDWFQGDVGVIFSEGEKWLELRRKVNRPMMQPRSAKQYMAPIDSIALEFVDRMLDLRDENGKMPLDFKNELNKWALESISLVALDARLGCLERNLPADSEQQRLIDATLAIFDCMLQLDLQPSPWRYVSTPAWRRLVKALDCSYEVSMRHITRALERVRARGDESQSTGELSVLEKLLISSDDPRIAIVMALDMMFGGIDTTANAMATTLYFLAKNPQAQQKLYLELCAKHPDPGTPLTAEILEDCKFLKACVKEALRLRPISIINMRRVLVDDLVLSNFRVPRGVDVVASHFVITNSEEHFPQASQFVPERWVKDAAGNCPARQVHPFAYLPFGFGPRMCVGKRFAEYEIHALLARIIRRFHVDYEGEVSWKTTVMHMIGSPLTFKITERHPSVAQEVRV
ncbi:probable cytochrome P450 301a1, mitochondrial [Schistocerca serialis cubense]|uniref:probable cytochrome P450 301a1, mitochondrial n=1 Tax=Schistocerca serialis cubense TaxID=2023355 RepID=UPI00214EA81F|nr:probable cytochrome P450 301a1, mitochondrial [Schistocerca serialis cubense]